MLSSGDTKSIRQDVWSSESTVMWVGQWTCKLVSRAQSEARRKLDQGGVIWVLISALALPWPCVHGESHRLCGPQFPHW